MSEESIDVSGEDGGRPHVTIGETPKPGETVDKVFVLVGVVKGGGEGIYGHKIGDQMVSFVTDKPDLKELLERHIRDVGSIEVCRREGTRLEWRVFEKTDEIEVIT
jgi:hypothetical protein